MGTITRRTMEHNTTTLCQKHVKVAVPRMGGDYMGGYTVTAEKKFFFGAMNFWGK